MLYPEAMKSSKSVVRKRKGRGGASSNQPPGEERKVRKKENTPGKFGFVTFPGERGSPETYRMDANFSYLEEFF